MPIINNIGILKHQLQGNGWHMTAFTFSYKNTEYDVLFEDIDNIPKKEKYASVKLTFIDVKNPNRKHTVEANQYKIFLNPQRFREYFGIAYSSNLGDVFKQFFQRFLASVPDTIPLNVNERQNTEIDRCLAQYGNRDPNAIYCYDARRLGKRDGKQMHRSIFITNLTKRRKTDLYEYFENEPTVTFYYSPNPNKELSTHTIINNFAIRENQKRNDL